MFEALIARWRERNRPAVRPIGAEAAAECAAIHRPSFAHPWSAAEFERLLCDRAAVADGAVDRSGRLAGFALSRVAADEAELLTIAVAPEWRRRGLARRILRAHLGRLAETHVERVFLEVAEDNAGARALYARLGFEPAGRRKAYYRAASGGRADALVLRRALV